jgi:hypothetical protein
MAFQLDSSLNLTTAATAAISMALASVVWWRRYRRLARLRARVARIHAVSEEILDALSPAEVVTTLGRNLSEILGPCTAAVEAGGAPEGTLALPMRVRGERAGTLVLRGLDADALHADERDALAHVANEVAICLRLLDQRRLREQILRGEQMGVAGQLVSSIAAELHAPLSRIAALAREQNNEQAMTETALALETLDRLISLGRPDLARVQRFDLNQLVRSLIEFRSRAWRLELLTVETELSSGELPVVGARGQIEQALLNLLVRAEQALSTATERALSIKTDMRGGRAGLLIAFTAPVVSDEEDAGLSVARGVVESHGGRMRAGETGFDLELPLNSGSESLSGAAPQPSRATHPLTLLLAHPDAQALRGLMAGLAARGHRVVEADSAGLALERVSRVRFDALFAARQLADLEWTGLAARAQGQVASVGLLLGAAEAAPPGVAALHLTVDETELDRVLGELNTNA